MKSQALHSYCVMWYYWWGCRGNLKLITLGNERIKLWKGALVAQFQFGTSWYWMCGCGKPRHGALVVIFPKEKSRPQSGIQLFNAKTQGKEANCTPQGLRFIVLIPAQMTWMSNRLRGDTMPNKALEGKDLRTLKWRIVRVSTDSHAIQDWRSLPEFARIIYMKMHKFHTETLFCSV